MRIGYTKAMAVMTCAAALAAGAQTVVAPKEPTVVPGSIVAAEQPFVDKQDFAGAVLLVASRDKIIDAEAVGYADIKHKIPMKTNDEFWIASQSKAFTTACMMMLVDEGKVKLDDPVEKYLPEFHGQMVATDAHVKDEKGAMDQRSADEHNNAIRSVKLVPADHPITIREIMSHSAGLPFKSSVETMPLDTRPLKIAVEQYGKDPLIFQPGTNYSYSNEGINTTGRIIEVVSGMPYEKFLQSRLLDPLGLTDTTFWPTSEQISRLAKAYKKDSSGNLQQLDIEQLTYPLDSHADRYPMPAGGLFSTAHDVALFCQMLLNGGATQDGKRLLSAAAVKEMISKQTPDAVEMSYGFGLFPRPNNGFAHGGAYNTSMQVGTEKGIVWIYMVQSAFKVTDAETHAIWDAFQGQVKE